MTSMTRCVIWGVWRTKSGTSKELRMLMQKHGPWTLRIGNHSFALRLFPGKGGDGMSVIGSASERTECMLSSKSIEQVGVFDSERVRGLMHKCDQDSHFSELDNMALAGIFSTQLVYDQFIEDFDMQSDFRSCKPDLVVDRRSNSL